MRKATIGNSLLPKLKAREKPYDVRDNKLVGFLIRVNLSGKMVYICEYVHGKRVTLGKVGVLTPAQARDRAKEILADATRGIIPAHKNACNKLTLAQFVKNEYQPWVETNRKSGHEIIEQFRAHFLQEFGNKLLSETTPLLLERWRTQRQKAGIKAATINRNTATLKAILSKAVEWGFIEHNPLMKLKPLKIDSIPIS